MRRGRILVVDDEFEVRQLFSRVLRRQGYEVVVAEGGRSAMRLLSSEQGFDLVLADLIMEEMGGMEMIRRARAGTPHVRFVVVSGKLVPSSEREELRALGIPLHAKPFRNDEVLASIARTVGETPATREKAAGLGSGGEDEGRPA